MAELHPVPLQSLVTRLLEEHRAEGSIFDLPSRAWYQGGGREDLSGLFHGERAATLVGPAAGPQSQMAQNLVLSWLGGARILELKTVQINDRLVLPRPCIDATNVGYNVEWSQELRLEDSLLEYVKGWMLLHGLKAWNPGNLPAAAMDTLFDLSVGYDLAGICSDSVSRWLDSAADSRSLIATEQRTLRGRAREFLDLPIPETLSSCVTLSTFHGCPAAEIERIVEHLLIRHRVHVVVKLNPTLLGLSRVEHLLHDRLGYTSIRPHAPSFANDLQWEEALAMLKRLSTLAGSLERTLGFKLTNTLVVHNHRDFFKNDEIMYLSGQPLHVLAITLAHQLVEALGEGFPVSFSAGIDKGNFADAVACGFTPITTCTDLLRPGGYGRLPKYLSSLRGEMQKLGVASVPDFILAREGGASGTTAEASRRNLAAYASRVAEDPRYAFPKNAAVPKRIGSHLKLFDCVSCDKCVPVCPNDANFTVEVRSGVVNTPVLIWTGSQVIQEPGELVIQGTHQIANYADFCNECGNCDVFCPEEGGPYKIKPRFFGSEASFLSEPLQDGLWVKQGPGASRRVSSRIEGVVVHLSWEAEGNSLRASDGVLEVTVDRVTGEVGEVRTRSEAPPPGHRLPLWRVHASHLLVEATLAGFNPVSAEFLN